MGVGGYLAVPAATGTWWRGAQGVRTVWRLGIFVAFVAILATAEVLIAAVAIHIYLKLHPHSHYNRYDIRHAPGIGPFVLAVFEIFTCLPILGATLFIARLETGGLAAYGIGRPGLRWLVNGGAFGLLAISILVLALTLAGFALVYPGGMGVTNEARYALEWLLTSLLIGFTEEAMFRGYLLHTLARGIGFWPAAIITSLLFGLLHHGNPGESPLGLLQVILFGLFLSLAIQQTGSLWWGIGFHALWDYGENFVFGSADSGNVMLHTYLHMVPQGSPYFSGGATGPEGSLFCTVVIVASAAFVWRGFSGARPGAKNLSPSTAT